MHRLRGVCARRTDRYSWRVIRLICVDVDGTLVGTSGFKVVFRLRQAVCLSVCQAHLEVAPFLPSRNVPFGVKTTCTTRDGRLAKPGITAGAVASKRLLRIGSGLRRMAFALLEPGGEQDESAGAGRTAPPRIPIRRSGKSQILRRDQRPGTRVLAANSSLSLLRWFERSFDLFRFAFCSAENLSMNAAMASPR